MCCVTFLRYVNKCILITDSTEVQFEQMSFIRGDLQEYG